MKPLVRCTRKIEFDAGHRIIGHSGKCKNLHGHRYTIEITIEAELLDELGMVVDFGIIKSIAKTWIDKNLDHTLILHLDDRDLGDQISSKTSQVVYYMNSNPTAENIAIHLKEVFSELFSGMPFRISKLKLFETPNCYVEV